MITCKLRRILFYKSDSLEHLVNGARRGAHKTYK